MTATQYRNAENDLLGRLQVMREAECGHILVVHSSDDNAPNSPGDGLDDEVVLSVSTEREKSLEEWRNYCNIVKGSKLFPKQFKEPCLSLDNCIETGAVREKGSDIKGNMTVKKCNLADFIDDAGHFNLMDFLQLQREAFPYLYRLSVCLASVRTNEVGCERFFSTAGYVSSPRRTRLKVRNYEMIAMLMRNMQHVFVDESWVVKEYIRMEKEKEWVNFDEEEDLKVLNLEQQIRAENLGLDVNDLAPITTTTYEELECEEVDLG